jgi:hypothetical protein
MGVVARIAAAVVGRQAQLSNEVLARYPELAQARWRRGGLPVRIGGWCLGQRTVSAITLWHTIWLASDLEPDDELLLHELRHVHQFQASRMFPVSYVLQSIRHGYLRNRYEVDAREYAAARVRHPPETNE